MDDASRELPGQSELIKNGLFTQGMMTLTEGVFLIDYALSLGASNMVIGLLASLPWFAQLLQIPSVLLVEQVRRRRLISTTASMLSRVSLLTICLIPWAEQWTWLAWWPGGRPGMLVAGLFAHYSFSSVGGCAWNSWMHDLIPRHLLGRFFSRRLSAMTGLAMGLSIAAGGFVTFCKRFLGLDPALCYVPLFLLGGLSGLVSVYHLARVPEPAMEPREIDSSILRSLATPLKDKRFRRLIIFLGAWNFAVNLAAPFFTVYMLDMLGLSMLFIIGLTLLSQGMTLFTLRAWGRIIDRFSNKSVLAVCAPLYIVCLLAWTFTTMPEPHRFTAPLLILIHILTGVSSAGVTLASGNIGLKLAPKGQATPYLATSSLVGSLAAGLAPILGGAFADVFRRFELTGIIRWRGPGGETYIPLLDFEYWDFFFGLAFVIGLYSIHRLFMIREQGSTKETVIVQELVAHALRDIRQFSSVSRFQFLLELPFAATGRGLAKLGKYRYVAAVALKIRCSGR